MTLSGKDSGTGVSGVVLAGGKSLRMGTSKALQRLGEKSIIERVVERIATLVKDIYVVANDVDSYAFLGLPIIPDTEPDRGPLMGLYTGITACRTPWVLVVACDTPFIEPCLLEAILVRPRATTGIVAVEVNGHLQPLPALYSAQCAPVARSLLSSGRRALRDVLAATEVLVVPEAEARQVDPELRTFFDLDTIEDLQLARRLIDSAH